MQDDYEESISLNLRTRSSKKRVGMLENKLGTPMAPAMPCKTCKKSNNGRPVARLMISRLNLRVSWKPVNPQECVWENHYQIIMKTILQEKGDNSLQHYNLVHKFIPMPQALKNSSRKGRSG